MRKVQVRAAPVEGSPAALPLTVDLDKPIGARPLAAGELKPNHRLLDVDQLSRSMRRRIHGLQSEEDPATLGICQRTSELLLGSENGVLPRGDNRLLKPCVTRRDNLNSPLAIK